MAYTGELGFEIWVPGVSHLKLIETLLDAGQDLGAGLVGIRALNVLRIEKGFGAWGLVYSPDYTLWESGMDKLVRLDKGESVGRAAARASQNAKKTYTIRSFTLESPGPDPWGGEPIEKDGTIVGYISSVAFGHRVGKVCALGYLYGDYKDVDSGSTVDVIGAIRRVNVLQQAPYDDPTGSIMRS